jgi:mRNA deadenylase 3'-5' endonuclease subunit Ccr4
MDKSTEEKLLDLYKNSADGLSTAYRLYAAARKKKINITLKQVEKAMEKWEVATRFRNKYKKQNRMERAIIPGPFHLFQLDLCIMPKYQNFIGILIW